jgi:MYXO-CTERM domain-containing protein
VDAAVVRCEPERAGSLPVLARREALMLGPDVSYGRDVRPLASPHAPSATDESVRAKGDVLRPVLLGLAALAALALLLRRRRASRA